MNFGSGEPTLHVRGLDGLSIDAARRRSRTLLLVILARSVSLAGLQITAFGIGTWLFQQTGSTAEYTLFVAATTVPSMLLLFAAGPMVDQLRLRTVSMMADAGGVIGSLILAVAVSFGPEALVSPLTLILIAAMSGIRALGAPAFQAAVTALAPPTERGRANGHAQLGTAVAQIAAPVLGAHCLHVGGPLLVLGIDGLLLAISLSSLRLLRSPLLDASRGCDASRSGRRFSALESLKVGVRVIREHDGLVPLLFVHIVAMSSIGIMRVLVTPLVLGFSNSQGLGAVSGCAGLGMLAGSLAVATCGERIRPRHAMRVAMYVLGALMLCCVRPIVWTAALGAFGVLFCLAVVTTCNVTLWQRLVPDNAQGTASAVKIALTGAVTVVAQIGAAAVVDRWLSPWMEATGALSKSAGGLLGTGPGRGAALMLLVVSAAILASAAIGFRRVPRQ